EHMSVTGSKASRFSDAGNGDGSSHRPQYMRIADTLEQRILKGTYRPNQALPTFNALSDEFSVSLVTVNKAIQELDGRGHIIRQRGKGVYASPHRQQNSSRLSPAPA